MLRKLFFAITMIAGVFIISAAAQQSGNGDRTPRQDREQRRSERQDRGERGGKGFERMDLDHDGFISATEWRGNEKAFGRIDTNNDGRISREEFNFFRQQKGGNASSRQKPQTI